MRQKLIIIESNELDNYDIPQLYFDENIIVIVYNEFTPNLFRYVDTPRIFLLPKQIYNSVMKNTYTITETTIKTDIDIISNTNATLNGVPYFPSDVIQLDVQNEYLENFRKYVPEKTREANIDNFDKAITELSKISVPVDNFNNLDIRIQRMIDFGDQEIALKLKNYFNTFKQDFLDAASLSLQFNNLDNISLNPIQSTYPALYYKLENNTGVYSWNGYSTYIDTLTRILFYTSVKDNLYTFSKHFAQHRPVVVVYGILNYHLAQNIHEKTNRNNKYYEMLLKELK